MLRYRIYQAEGKSGNAFKELSEIGEPKLRDYVMVYENGFTTVAANKKGDICLLENLFYIFNEGDKPKDYMARSMSTSDVVELYEDTAVCTWLQKVKRCSRLS